MKKSLIVLLVAVASLSIAPLVSLAGGSFYIDSVTGFVGIGNTTPASSLDVSGAMYSRLVTASSTAIDWNAGNVQTMTLNSSPTLTFSNGQAGGEYKLILNQDGTGSRTVTWPASVKWAGGSAPTLTTNGNAIDTVSFIYDGTNYLGSYNLTFGGVTSTLLSGLIAYWKLDGNSNDATGNGHNGTDTDVTYSSGDGKISQGANFTTASSSCIGITDSTDLKPTGDFTINSWVKLASGGGASILNSFSQNSNVAGLGFFASPTNSQLITGKNTGTTFGTDYKSAVGTATLGTSWHMITAVYDGTHMYTYIDGNSTPDASTAWSNNPAYAATNYVRIGCRSQTGSDQDFSDTSMDEIGFWGRVLTSAEITQLYNSGTGRQYPF